METFLPQINKESQIPKFQQIIDEVVNAISDGRLKEGDILPSVNTLVQKCHLSRDTVFKAYKELRTRRVIESVPNKGYFVSSNRQKVFLFLDTFKAYKEVLYHSFRDALPSNCEVDVHFHHYNVKVFESIINDSLGKYSHYIIMNFDHPRVSELTQKIDPTRLLVIDWDIHAQPKYSFVKQDFGQALYDCLGEVDHILKNYKKCIFLYPDFTYHPKESIDYFSRYCSDHNISFEILTDIYSLDPHKGEAYLLVSDRTLVRLIDLTRGKGLKLGEDVGVISYNETPMKKYIDRGITVISTDFVEMGKKAAEFVQSNSPVKYIVPTYLILRHTL